MLKFLMLSSVNTNFGYYFSNQVNLQEIFSTGTVCTLKASTGITCQLFWEKRGMRLWIAKWGFNVHWWCSGKTKYQKHSFCHFNVNMSAVWRKAVVAGIISQTLIYTSTIYKLCLVFPPLYSSRVAVVVTGPKKVGAKSLPNGVAIPFSVLSSDPVSLTDINLVSMSTHMDRARITNFEGHSISRPQQKGT